MLAIDYHVDGDDRYLVHCDPSGEPVGVPFPLAPTMEGTHREAPYVQLGSPFVPEESSQPEEEVMAVCPVGPVFAGPVWSDDQGDAGMVGGV